MIASGRSRVLSSGRAASVVIRRPEAFVGRGGVMRPRRSLWQSALVLVCMTLAGLLGPVRAQQGAAAEGEWRSLRRRSWQHQVLAAHPNRREQFRQARAGLALAVGRRLHQPHAARRRRGVGELPRHLRAARSGGPEALARSAAALRPELQGDAADGRRAAVSEYPVFDWRGDRRARPARRSGCTTRRATRRARRR